MIPAKFDYAAPDSIDTALALLTGREGAKLLAGGHSLLADMKLRRTTPSLLVDLRKIPGLRGINRHSESGGLQVGAMTTYVAIARAQGIADSHPVLADAAAAIGYPQVRNYGTIGGNLAYGHPAGDMAAAVLALEAIVNVVGPTGARSIPASSFFVAPFRTILAPGEVITSIEFPPPAPRAGGAYEKMRHPANGYAVCGVAARVEASLEETIVGCAVAVTGVAFRATRLRGVEAELEGKKPTPETIAAAAKRAGEGLTSFSDLYASAEYRIHLTEVLTERALVRAAQRAGLSAPA